MPLELVFAKKNVGREGDALRTRKSTLSRAFTRKCGGENLTRYRCGDTEVVEKITEMVGEPPEMAITVLSRLAKHDAKLVEGGALVLAMLRSKRDMKGSRAEMLQVLERFPTKDIFTLLKASMAVECDELTEFLVAYVVSEWLDLDPHACVRFAAVEDGVEPTETESAIRDFVSETTQNAKTMQPQTLKKIVEDIQTCVHS